jgi:NAD(P)-dependent dehydrogenase (short-subunit alcohol dehydrogenase family)
VNAPNRSGGTPRWNFDDRIVAITRTEAPRGNAQRLVFEAAGAKVVEAAATDEPAIERLVAEISDLHGRLDILVVNGGPVPSVPLLEMTESAWDAVIDDEVTVPFLLFKHLVPLMGEDSLGKVVVTAGPQVSRGYRDEAAHCAASHGVFGLAKDLACEVGRRQINVNLSCPSPAVDDPAAEDHDGALDALTENVLWLSSDASRFVTGTAVQVNRVAV